MMACFWMCFYCREYFDAISPFFNFLPPPPSDQFQFSGSFPLSPNPINHTLRQKGLYALVKLFQVARCGGVNIDKLLLKLGLTQQTYGVSDRRFTNQKIESKKTNNNSERFKMPEG